MVTYEVVAKVDAEHRHRYEHFMQHRHIAEVVATGCFTGARFERAAEGQYRTRYLAKSREDVDRYLAGHTAGLRADFVAHFPDGVTLAREVWTEIAGW